MNCHEGIVRKWKPCCDSKFSNRWHCSDGRRLEKKRANDFTLFRLEVSGLDSNATSMSTTASTSKHFDCQARLGYIFCEQGWDTVANRFSSIETMKAQKFFCQLCNWNKLLGDSVGFYKRPNRFSNHIPTLWKINRKVFGKGNVRSRKLQWNIERQIRRLV